MIKRLICVALAICMFGTALVAAGAVSAQTVGGTIVPTDPAGDKKEVFFLGERVYYKLSYIVDDMLESGTFRVSLTDFGGNVMSSVVVTTPSDAVYQSTFGTSFFLNPWWSEGKYILNARLLSTGVILASAMITVLGEKIVIEPLDRDVYVPGETVTVRIVVNTEDKVNVTIPELNETLTVNRTLINYSWSTEWQIPEDTEPGWYMIYVNDSLTDANLLSGWLQIEHFMFEMFTDRYTYLPGETATFHWIAVDVITWMPVEVSVNFSMSYRNVVNNEDEWWNETFYQTPFDVVIPAVANIGNDIWIEIVAHSEDNQTSESWIWLDLDYLRAAVTADKATYYPGDTAVVTVTATVGTWQRLPGATVSIMVDDTRGGVLEGLAVSNLTTDSSGIASGVLEIPEDIDEMLPDDMVGNYKIRFIATVSKLAYQERVSVTVNIADQYEMTVQTDKMSYVSGESISVTVELKKNGQLVEPDFMYYYLMIGWTLQPPIHMTESTSFQMTAPSDIEGEGSIGVIAVLGNDEIYAQSNWFDISRLILTLSASKLDYNAGDKINFEVLVIGDLVGLTVTYSIRDDDGAPVSSGTLNIGTAGKGSFSLSVPKDQPSPSYTVQVIADNGMGLTKVRQLTVELISDYLINFWVKSSPKYASGDFAPGQKIVVAFEIIPQGKMPALSIVTARVTLTTMGIDGELKTFTKMSGELSITIPENARDGEHTLRLTIVELGATPTQMITVSSVASGWDRSIVGLSAANWVMLVLLVIVVIMLAIMMRGRGGAPVPAAVKKEEPAEKPKPEPYQPQSSVKCPACGGMIDIGTSKRPIEVMCPKCGTSQMIN